MTLRGSVASFPLETVVQLLAATAKTGQLEIRSGIESGTLGFADGKLVSAVAGDDSGDQALGAVFTLADGDFEFVPWDEAPKPNLAGELNELLDRALEQRDKIIADREVISHDEVRFALSDRAAAKGEVRLTAEQWRTLLAVNGERDLRAIADQLGIGRLAALAMLAELVRAGIVNVEAPPPAGGPDSASTAEPSEATPPGAAEEPAHPAEAPRTWGLSPETWQAATEKAHAQVEPVRPDESLDDSLTSRIAALDRKGSAKASDAEAAPDDRLSALTGEEPAATPAWPRQDRVEPGAGGSEPRSDQAPEEPKRKGSLFSGLFKKEEGTATAERPVATDGTPRTATRVTRLAAFANALLDEFKDGQYGKGRVDDRIANLLMRVDEQADPIDRPLPIVDDRIDVATLERANMPDRQVAPYLALLITQIYEDAAQAFGKDKAKRGFKTVQHSAGDPGSLGTDLRLPKV